MYYGDIEAIKEDWRRSAAHCLNIIFIHQRRCAAM